MLVLAVHSVAQVTAKVAFSTILLQDFITNNKVPDGFKCRQLVPTSGSRSISLWDCSDPDVLLAWLTENISVDCEHEVFEVQEDFGIGLAEVQRQRATERVTTGTKDVAQKTAHAVGAAASATVQSVQDFDQKMRITERAGNAVDAVKDSAAMQNTAAALSKAGSSVKAATNKVFEQPAVANATEAVGSGFRKLGASLTSFTRSVVPSSTRNPSVGETHDQSDLDARGSVIPEELPRTASPAMSTQAPAGSAPGAPAFTLHDP